VIGWSVGELENREEERESCVREREGTRVPFFLLASLLLLLLQV
jgi:hypothetical protein